jgi:hypothetical protein
LSYPGAKILLTVRGESREAICSQVWGEKTSLQPCHQIFKTLGRKNKNMKKRKRWGLGGSIKIVL